MYSSDAKFEEHRLNISRDILDRVCTVLVKPPMTSSIYSQKRKYLENEKKIF